jgi:carbonic anhydrase
MNSQQALAKLVSGVQKFQTEVFPGRRRQFEALGHQQNPTAMFFTCADSRIVPNLLLQTEPGEVFTERTPGNIVPKYSEHIGGVTASMEFAIQVLHVPLIVVCGHTDCGVIKALLEPENASGMPALQSWMRHSLPARERLIRDHSSATREEKLRHLTEYNVLVQLENLKTHPAVESRLTSGQVDVRGWVYDIASGSVYAANPETGVFELLPGTSGA